MKREKEERDNVKKIIEKYAHDEINISKHYLDKINEGKRDFKANFIEEKVLEKNFYFVEKQINEQEIRYQKVLSFYHGLKSVVCFGLIKNFQFLNAIKNATVSILEVWTQAKSFTDFAAQRIAILSNSLVLKILPHIKVCGFLKES